jgi:hypothetical protein
VRVNERWARVYTGVVIVRGIFGVLWGLALVWIGICAWSFWMGEQSPFEWLYFAVRDAFQPGGYAIRSLRHAPTWAVFHLVLGAAPSMILLLCGRIARRG